MLRPFLLPLVLTVLLAATPLGVCADKVPSSPQTTKGTILVRFHDGGLLHMSFAGDTLPVTTKHGKLKIAVSDIRKLELATRIPDNIRAEIQIAIRDLGAEQFKLREAAEHKLKSHKEKAYSDLLEAAKSPDSEVQRRVNQLLTWLRETVSEDKLKVRLVDSIHTDDSVISGKIETDVITVETAQFGKVELKLADASSILFVGSGATTDLKMDGKYALQTEVWMDTYLDFLSGSMLSVEATGEIDMYATGGYVGQYVGTPRGKKAWPGNTGLPHEPGVLIGRIGKNGTPFVIGGKFEGHIKEEGRLYLRAAGNPYSVQTAGEYTIRITGGMAAK